MLSLTDDVGGAIVEYKECLRMFPNDQAAHSDLASLYEQSGQSDEEIQEFKRYIAIAPPPQDESERFDLARVLQRAGQLSDAAAECQEILRGTPDDPQVHDQLGEIRLQQGYLPDALYEFTTASALEPDRDEYHIDMAFTLDRLERPEDAISQFRIALKLSPQSAWVHNNFAWFYATTKNFKYRNPQAALGEAKEAMELSEGKESGIIDTLAEAYFSNRQFDEAMTTESKAIDLDPDNLQLQQQLDRFKRHDIDSPPATE
jgi:Flp pilus assembly protein TadD